jgi:hypothetical protein
MPRDSAPSTPSTPASNKDPAPTTARTHEEKFQEIGTVLEPDWCFLSEQDDLATILNKLQWVVKAGVPHAVSCHEITTHRVYALAKATMGTVLDIPDIAVASLL